MFDTKGEWFCEDIRKADPSDIPDFELLCGGFPCQSFSIAGNRGGFSDPRGTLFFEIARLTAAKRPAYLLLENVPGLLNHDRGRTFAAILHKQSPDIAAGVDCSLEQRRNVDGSSPSLQLGAGDQGIVVGYACSETSQMLPLPVVLAHRLTSALTIARKSGAIQGLRPDGKAQVTVEYDEDGKPFRLDTVVLSAQHSAEIPADELCFELTDKVIAPALQVLPPDEDTKILINPAGRFVIGGPEADTGLTGRKLMVDSFGVFAPHGGGAFSGKDATKVDRSGAYMARYIAKNLVAAGLCERCQVTLAYAIGAAQPVMVEVDTLKTGTICADDCLADAVKLVFGLTPAEIIAKLDLLSPRYTGTAAYGHFGRPEFPWERTDQAKILRAAVI